MNKKYILGIVASICVIFITTFVWVSATIATDKQSLLDNIENNNTTISNIEDAQSKLHETAESLRKLQNNDTELIDSLSSKWLELNETKNQLVADNTKYQNELEKIKTEESNKRYLGEFELTAYCYGNRTSTGTTPTVHRTIAVDPKVIPYGSKVYIEGYGTYIAEDCGGAIKGNIIDVFLGSYNECIQFGRRRAKVYIINN